jgi:putative ABC transport system substrate-binding protein
LIEATVDNTSAVGEVVSSLVTRGAELILMHGDHTVGLGVDSVVASARRGKIPVFTTMPALIGRGVAFAAGADYYDLGQLTGALAIRVMKGEDIDKMPIEYFMPKQYAVDRAALVGLKDNWQIPEDLIRQAKKIL